MREQGREVIRLREKEIERALLIYVISLLLLLCVKACNIIIF